MFVFRWRQRWKQVEAVSVCVSIYRLLMLCVKFPTLWRKRSTFIHIIKFYSKKKPWVYSCKRSLLFCHQCCCGWPWTWWQLAPGHQRLPNSRGWKAGTFSRQVNQAAVMMIWETRISIGIFYLEVVFQRRSLRPHVVWNQQTVLRIIRRKVVCFF